MNRKRFTFCVVALVLLTGGIAYWRLISPPLQNAPTPLVQGDAKLEPEDEKARRKLLGVWQDDYKGKRTMTLNEDGTGTMLVELSGLQATFFAAKLHFDMQWSLKGMTLTKKTVGGDPADKVNMILNTMGNTAEDKILESSDDRLLLLDKDGTTRYDWRRAKKEEKEIKE